MPRDRWLECRDHGPKGDIEYTVGGSDVSTIFGVNPWVTPLELWMQKKGRMKRSDPKNQNQLDMGHMMEPIAAHFYGIVTGNKVVPDTNMYQHADFPYALADFDYRFEDKASGGIEPKPLHGIGQLALICASDNQRQPAALINFVCFV